MCNNFKEHIKLKNRDYRLLFQSNRRKLAAPSLGWWAHPKRKISKRRNF